jgi:hypothetical protein
MKRQTEKVTPTRLATEGEEGCLQDPIGEKGSPHLYRSEVLNVAVDVDRGTARQVKRMLIDLVCHELDLLEQLRTYLERLTSDVLHSITKGVIFDSTPRTLKGDIRNTIKVLNLKFNTYITLTPFLIMIISYCR